MNLMAQRVVVQFLRNLIEYISFKLFYSGGIIFRIFEMLYIRNFDTTHRMRSEGVVAEGDHENPSVVGRKKRLPHSVLRAFPSVTRTSISLLVRTHLMVYR